MTPPSFSAEAAEAVLRPQYVLFAAYNAWANRRLYATCATLPPEALTADRKGFFRSILGTLNHILVGDMAWHGRLTGQDHGVRALDQILYSEFPALRAARERFDQAIATMVDSVPLSGLLSYRTLAGSPQQTPYALVLAHMFNHQTHHRGQVHGMLSQGEIDPPPLDFIYFLRDAPSAPQRNPPAL